mmetsp:Transcript_19893/g.50096  ORF Transcript_19893/g.50096 Transcript_19893/m.50096 type:complete len:83 (-) Transcript_19893:46-294(-)
MGCANAVMSHSAGQIALEGFALLDLKKSHISTGRQEIARFAMQASIQTQPGARQVAQRVRQGGQLHMTALVYARFALLGVSP